MRQFFSPRFWLTLLALGGLALLLTSVFGGSTGATGTDPAQKDSVTTHQIDLVSWVYGISPAPGFTLQNGVTTEDMALQLDATRTMIIKAGTPGEITCSNLTVLAHCTVAADLLGDAVLWFSIVPGTPGATVQLPAVVALLDGGRVQLANDWIVRRASQVERSCVDDTSSLTDFIKTYGETASSTFNFDSQKIVKVTCPRAPVTPPSETVAPGGVVDTVVVDASSPDATTPAVSVP